MIDIFIFDISNNRILYKYENIDFLVDRLPADCVLFLGYSSKTEFDNYEHPISYVKVKYLETLKV